MRRPVRKVVERAALMRIVRQFFFDHLVGVISIDETMVIPAEKVERQHRGRRAPEWDRHRKVEMFDEGKTRDIIEMEFRNFVLRVLGPGEGDDAGTYPLGKVTIWYGTESIEGPIDVVTWAKVAAFIKARGNGRHGETTGDSRGDSSAGAAW